MGEEWDWDALAALLWENIVLETLKIHISSLPGHI